MQKLEFAGFGGLKLAGDAFGEPDSPAAVLLPPSGQSREFWHGSARALAQAGRYAICIDLRGHGDSGRPSDGRYDLDAYADDLTAVLSALPSRAFVIAAGMGGIAAMVAVGENATSLVAGLALVDVNIWFEEGQYEQLRDALVRRASGQGDSEAVLEVIAAAHPAEPRPQPTARLLAAFTRQDDGRLEWRGDPKALASDGLFGQQARLSSAASRIKVPVALVRGSLNQTITDETLRRLQALIPGSEVAEIEGAGHYLVSDREDAFNSILLDFLERHAPRQPLTYLGGSEPRLLRDALGCFGTGVTVITTLDGAGEPIGLTANSFTSVSLDPPLILFSLAKSSANLAVFQSAGRFAVNVLHIGQQPVANRFAQRDAARFKDVDWSIKGEGGEARAGSPILHGSLASFDCRTFAVHDGGDHLIFIGQVDQAWFEPNRDPLFYFRGRYRRLHFA